MRDVLIATLGHKPQVVTTAADLLLAQGRALEEATVLHTAEAEGPLGPGLERLRAEFAAYAPYRSIRLRLEAMAGEAGPLRDVESEADAAAAFRAIYGAVRRAKEAGARRTVHLSIVGGRKVLAVYGMAAAQLLFDDEDCLWYVLAGGRFLAEGRMHPGPGDEARLVRAPVLRWGAVSPMLTDLREFEDPFAAAEHQRERQVRERLELARGFVLGALTGAERRVVELVAREGLTDEEAAGRRGISSRTVEQHLRSAYRKALARWELPRMNRTSLASLLSPYYALESPTGRFGRLGEIPHDKLGRSK